MANAEDEIKDLREKNNELVQKVQYWKMLAAQRENEKLDLMKENNELRLKVSRLRSGGAAQARQLDVALQSTSEEALSHLVQASSAVARTLELAKSYIRDRQELDASSPRWSAITGTPTTEKVNKVRPISMGGRTIQPVVALSRTLVSTSLSRSVSRRNSESRNGVTQRPLPMHMLQDVYIPLTRIDVSDLPRTSLDNDENTNDSAEDLGLEDNVDDEMEESANMSDDQLDLDTTRRLDAVEEDLEPEEDETINGSRIENPLEGPSWLLDQNEPSSRRSKSFRGRSQLRLEADSTTGAEPPAAEPQPASPRAAFTPTVRRRKRAAPTGSDSGRILMVLVPKMRLNEDDGPASPPPLSPAPAPSPAPSPAKRPLLDAPSPNGATATVIISETEQTDDHIPELDAPNTNARTSQLSRDTTPDRDETNVTRDSPEVTRGSRTGRGERRGDRSERGDTRGERSERDSDSSGGEERTRRRRKPVTYREIPLNVKMRR